jgi:hypothetical protein
MASDTASFIRNPSYFPKKHMITGCLLVFSEKFRFNCENW